MKQIFTFFCALMALLSNAQNPPGLHWVKQMGFNQNGTSVYVDAVGNVYTTGVFFGTSDFDPGIGVSNLTSSGSIDIFVSKLDASGNFVWAKQLGGVNSDFAHTITGDALGNIYTTGYFKGPADFNPGPAVNTLTSVSSSYDGFISKLDASGNFVWAKAFGGSGDEQPTSIAVDAAGNVYTTGCFQNTADFDPGVGVFNMTVFGTNEIFVSKLDVSGNFVWAKQFLGVSFIESDRGDGIAVDAAGNVYTTGFFHYGADFDPGPATYTLTSVGNSPDVFVSKLDASGNFVWVKQLGGTAADYAEGITLDPSGNVYTTGTFGNTADFDPGAGTFNITGYGGTDIFISKLDASGNFVLAKRLGGPGNDYSQDIEIDQTNNIYTTGYFNGTCDFDPGPSVYNLTSVVSLNDSYISRLDALGNFMWTRKLGGNNSVQCHSMSLDLNRNVHTTGNFNSIADFDPDIGVFNLNSANGTQFVHKLGLLGEALNFDGTNDNVNIINPVTNDFSIECWIKTSQIGSLGAQWYNGNGIIDADVAGVTNDFGMSLVGNNLAFGIGNPDVTLLSTININTGNWTHVAATWKQSTGTMKIYINGVLDNSGTSSGFAPRTSPTSIKFGCLNTNNNYFNGDLDETRVWSRELCQAEIQNNMNGELPVGQTGLLSYYKFNQGLVAAPNPTVTTLIDASGNSNTGSLNNFALTGIVSNWTAPGGILAGVNTLPFLTPTISGINSICNGSSTTFTASGLVTYTWIAGPNTDTYNISPSTTTAYSVIGTNSAGCVSNIAIKTLTVLPNPSITVNSGSICNGNSFTITPGGAVTYTFSSGSAIVSPTINTSYSITGTGANGCISINPTVSTVTVNAVPTITASSGTICSGNSFTIVPTGASTYTFSNGSAIVSPTTNTSYSITGTSPFGCVSSNTAVSNITVNSLPIIIVNATPTLICPGETSTITANGALTYTWNTTAINNTISVSPLTTANYTVNATDINTCKNSAVISVSVGTIPVINIINSNSVICFGQSATLTANGADTYTWNTTSTNTTIVVSPTINTTYSVTGTNAFGCTASVINNVTVNTLPIISVNSGTICSGQSFTLIPSGANTYTYEGGSAFISPTVTTSYTVVGTSTAGCISASFATSNITVNTTPTLAISLSPLSGSICPPPTASPAFFNVSGANTYTWMPGSFVSSSPIVQPPVSTNYTVTGTALNGCTTTSALFLFVHPQPILGVILPTLACNGNTACFNTGGDLIFFSWNGPCGDASSQPNPCLMANTSCGSTYTVGGSNANGCIATTTVNIIVNPSPTVSAVSNSGLICAGQTATITASGANTYIWNTTATTQVIAVSPTITTSYTVTGTNGSGCTDLAIITQSVSACTGIQNLNSIIENIKFYPNPTSSNFIIELETINAETKIEIINSLGQIVLVEPLTDIKSSIKMESFCNGIYFLKIISDNKTILNAKVVKE